MAQKKDSLISENITGHIYKPKMVGATEERISQLQLPQGFKIEKFADNLGEPRMMAVSPQGNIYVSRREGDVVMLKDTNDDGKPDHQQTVVTKEGAHGVAFHEDMFYLVTVNDVFRAQLKEDGTIGELEKIIGNLPDGGQHPNRTIGFGPDGMLYISIGSTCNACDETREENATIVRTNADGSNRTIFASGLRNTIGFDWHPETGELFGMDSGIDWLGDDEQKEELNRITEGADYGWPYIYDDGKYNKADEPPKMTWKEYAQKATEPEMLFTAHSAPMNLKFYRGKMFPSEYKNTALVTFRGSWNRRPASGHKIMKVTFENGKPVKAEDFVKGFLMEEGTSRFARLAGLVELPDGSLLVSDDTNGVIYRVSYN
ncbi:MULTISPECIES: PQQ-dependent sugar dehydrogenase [Flavobacteriaceae]|nr:MULTISPECIES: PQQ-dependent sugar dehydrogenase [Flavobacteriaceae]GGW91534.1 oxidoreductase [Salegentibacter mishustinae]